MARAASRLGSAFRRRTRDNTSSEGGPRHYARAARARVGRGPTLHDSDHEPCALAVRSPAHGAAELRSAHATVGSAWFLRTSPSVAANAAPTVRLRLLLQRLPAGCGAEVAARTARFEIRASWDFAQYDGRTTALSRHADTRVDADERRRSGVELEPASRQPLAGVDCDEPDLTWRERAHDTEAR